MQTVNLHKQFSVFVLIFRFAKGTATSAYQCRSLSKRFFNQVFPYVARKLKLELPHSQRSFDRLLQYCSYFKKIHSVELIHVDLTLHEPLLGQLFPSSNETVMRSGIQLSATLLKSLKIKFFSEEQSANLNSSTTFLNAF